MKISFIIVNYNASEQIKELLESIKESIKHCEGCIGPEVIIVDNASHYDDYLKLKQLEKRYAKLEYPSINVRVFRLSRNYGYSGGVNIGVRLANGNIIIVSNPDIVLEKDFLANLAKIYTYMDGKLFRNSIIVPKILIGKSNKINSTGMTLHVAGYGILLNLNKKFDDPLCNEVKLVLAPHGALFIAYKKILLELGPFDPYYFSFLEDLDLGLRAYAKGYCVIYIPTLVVRHYWGLTWGKGLSRIKYYYAERNRLLSLLNNLPYKYILAFLPYILISEIISQTYALLNRCLSMKIRIYADIIRSLAYIKRRRSTLISNNISNYERYLSKCMTIEFIHVFFDKKYIYVVNKLYSLINKIVKIHSKIKI